MSSIHDRINKAISQYSVALMSNTKWKVVFEQIADHELVLSVAYVREHSYGSEQKITNLRLEDSHIADGVLFGGPITYKEIYGLRINRFESSKNPTTGATLQSEVQSISFLTNLDKLGKYPIEVTEKHIFINGYK